MAEDKKADSEQRIDVLTYFLGTSKIDSALVGQATTLR
jgi:hypothetical protein